MDIMDPNLKQGNASSEVPPTNSHLFKSKPGNKGDAWEPNCFLIYT